MAAGWVKSLQCKSKAYEDVVHYHSPKQLFPNASCKSSYQNLKDVVSKHNHNDHTIDSKKPKRLPKPKKPVKKPDPFDVTHHRKSAVSLHSQKHVPHSLSSSPNNIRVRRTVSAPIKSIPVDPFFPSVSELQEGHPSRNVVEIIFQTRWGRKGFSGRVETVFKIQSPVKELNRFEEYRNRVRTRSGIEPGSREGHARCSADGNEMMRFRCLGSANATSIGVGFGEGKGSVVCTYSGSGTAHDSAGGGKGRRAMMVCRVIAGRVLKRPGPGGVGLEGCFDGPCDDDYKYDSVSGENGELLVFDNRAVLPCFLVIYKL